MSDIVYLDAYTTNPGDISWQPITALGEVDIYDYSTMEEAIKRSQNATILIVNKFNVSREFIAQLPNLGYVVVSATGYNNVDVEACKQAGIAVSNVRGYSTTSVAQHVFSNILAVLNQPSHYHHEVAKGRWAASRDFCFYDESIVELDGQKIGLIGYGDIGKKISAIAIAFGMRVLIYTRTPGSNTNQMEFVTLEECLAKSSIVSLHAPLNDQTKHIINAKSLALMQPNAILVNTSRGPLIDEDALAAHLANTPTMKAIIDVLSAEPPKADNPLFALRNCYITPHIAWASINARIKLVQGVADNIVAFNNGTPINIVNS